MNELVGRTLWDFLVYLISGYSILWITIIALIVLVVVLILKPHITKEWNAQFTMWIAHFVPKKRKSAFSKTVNLTISSAMRKLSKETPQLYRKLLPCDLKVEWVSENDGIETLIKEKQVIIYVPNYKEQEKQVVSILHNYCINGVAQKAKYYMPDATKQATDIVITKRLIHHTGPRILDYFNREYVPDLIKNNQRLTKAYQNLKIIDDDGLFLPVLINEIDKFACRIYPQNVTTTDTDIIVSFTNFVFAIATKAKGENVPTLFNAAGIKVRIILAVSEESSINIPLSTIENDLEQNAVNTIYVLATGQKIDYAEAIANDAYNQNPQFLNEPVKTSYVRYGRNRTGKIAVCYELNLRSFNDNEAEL